MTKKLTEKTNYYDRLIFRNSNNIVNYALKILKIQIYHSLDILQARIFSIDERNFLAFKTGIPHGLKNFEKCDEALDCAVIQMRKDKIV